MVAAEVVYGSSHASAVVDLLREALSILHEEANWLRGMMNRGLPNAGYPIIGA